ncbi:MAG: alpha-mannosidase, partial [Actinomycetota bacterium]
MSPEPQTVLHVVPHTHWDREWYEPFEGYRLRLVRVLDRLLDVLESPGAAHFHFDGQTAAIEDYVAVRPEAAPRIRALVAAGRLAVGPWRILMDEFLCSPETIVRNLRQGAATARVLGADPRLGYIPDSFGHIAQMPQILALAGMTDACVWRGVPFAVDRPAFWWTAPDGTRIRTMYLATSYSNAASLPETFEDLIVRAKRIVTDMAAFRPEGVVLAMNGTDHQGLQEHLSALFTEANSRQDEVVFRLGSMAEYVAAAPHEGLPAWSGEMRSSARANLLMGVCSARMPLKRAEFEASAELERYAEPLAALSGFDPGTMLDEAWRAMVENSAHDSVCGCGIDAVADAVLDRYRRARRVAELVAAESLGRLAERVTRNGDGVLVFNPSPFERGGVAEATVPFPQGAALAGDDGAPRAVQVLGSTEQVVVDMTLRGSELARIVPTIHSRMMGALYVNRMELVPGRTRTLRLELGPIPVGRFDVEAAKRDVEAAASTAPRARFHVIGVGPPLVRLLLDAPPVGGLGWR